MVKKLLLKALAFSLLCSPSLAQGTTSISHGPITFELSGVTSSGHFLDGIAWVMGNNIKLLRTLPRETEEDGSPVNLAVKNPSRERDDRQKQGWDGRWGSDFDPTSHIEEYPLSLTTHDIIVKAQHRPKATDEFSVREGISLDYGALVVCDSKPSAQEMGPAVIGWPNRGVPKTWPVDIDAALAALPTYDTDSSSGGITMPSFDELMSHFDKFAFGPAFTLSTSGIGYEAMLPFDFTTDNNYGREVGSTMGVAATALLSNEYTSDQKRKIAIKLCQIGIQLWDRIEAGQMRVGPDGGHFQWHMIPILAALRWTGRDEAISTLKDDAPGNILGQPFTITSQTLEDMKPHNDLDKFGVSRRREVIDVKVNPSDVEVEVPVNHIFNRADPYRLRVWGMMLTREADGAEALILSVSPDSISGKSSTTVTVENNADPPFAAGDVVTFQPRYELIVGESDWSIRHVDRPAHYVPGINANYRELQGAWTWNYFWAKALGVDHETFDAFYAYVEQANREDYPSKLDDFGGVADTRMGVSSSAWWQEFGADPKGPVDGQQCMCPCACT